MKTVVAFPMRHFIAAGSKKFVLGMVIVALVVACTNDIQDGDPLFGPVTASLIITPSSGQVAKGGTLTFTATGATAPLFWSLSSTSIGSIVVSTGVFTATTIAGTATITLVDSGGKTGTATVTVLPSLLTITPGAAVANVAGTTLFTGAGGTASFLFSIANDDTTSTFTLPTLTSTATTVTVTFGIPTALQGNQTFTISAVDIGNGDVGAAKLTLLSP